MSQRTEKRSYEREVVTEITCDICGNAMPIASPPYREQVELAVTAYDYDGGGVSEKSDICYECYKGKIIPLLKTPPRRMDF